MSRSGVPFWDGREVAPVLDPGAEVAPATRMTGRTGSMQGEIPQTIPATKPMMTSSTTGSSYADTVD